MYKIVWSTGPWDEHDAEFSIYDEMQDFYSKLLEDTAVTYACKYELVAIGEFTR
jgi:hypothetical protein